MTKTEQLISDIEIQRYGRPLAAALLICSELERELTALRDLIGNDAYAITFQSMRQYRNALLGV